MLGAKLKGDFKKTMAAIQALTDSELVQFKQTGQVTVCGHSLVPEDLRLMYTTQQGTQDKYEAHSEGEVSAERVVHYELS